MIEFEVTGPTPGLCIRTQRGHICTRIMDHEGDHLWAKDSLTAEERFLVTAKRFPVTVKGE